MGQETATWLRRLAFIAVGLVGGWFLWGKLSGALSFEQVGPGPAAGRQVVMLLHGAGAPGDDLVGLAKELSDSLPNTTFLVPEGPHTGYGARVWVPSFSAPSREEYVARLAVELEATNAQAWKLIDQVRAKGVACENINLGGFSQGGRVAAELAARAPPTCHLGGLLIMSGGGLDEAVLPRSSSLRRVLVTHGTNDPVVGLGVGLALAQRLKADGDDVRWLEFAGKHQIPEVVTAAIPLFLRGEEVAAPVP